MVSIVSLSDSHNNDLEEVLEGYSGDILIHAGDFTDFGSKKEIEDFNNMLGKIKHKFKHVLVIAGNHDIYMQNPKGKELITNAIYLEDKLIVLEGLRIYGSPWVPYINGCFAFELESPERARKIWKKIPENLHILITHGGCSGILSGPWGDFNLKAEVFQKKPKIMVHGHTHMGHGYAELGQTKIYNVAICNNRNEVVREPTVIEV